jgi:drug/metabolite transporter (DMT)-like permease
MFVDRISFSESISSWVSLTGQDVGVAQTTEMVSTGADGERRASAPRPPSAVVPVAVAAVWVIWGSTYLGIKIGLETMPPFFMQGCRFVFASAILFAIARRRGAVMPTRRQFANAALVGILLLIGGLGMVTLAEDRGVDTGLIATLIAIQPLLMSLWGGLWGTWPGRKEWIGMAVGLVGVGVLMSDGGLAGTSSGIALVLVACTCWSFGSALSRRIDMPAGAMASVCEMAAAAVAFMVLAAIRQEHVEVPSLRSGLALAYLVTFGSVIAFSAFTFLIGNVRPALAMSYAYVNPMIAVVLGTLFNDEELSVNLVIALPIILAGVAMVTAASRIATPAEAVPDT